MKDSTNTDIRLPFEAILVRLQKEGFILGVDELSDFQKILLSYGQEGLDDPDKLKFLLAPAVCKNPSEQEKFYRIFDESLASALAKGRQIIEDGDEEEQAIAKTQENRRLWRWRLMAIALVLVCSSALYLWIAKPLETVEPPPAVIDTAAVYFPAMVACPARPEVHFSIAGYADSTLEVSFLNTSPRVAGSDTVSFIWQFGNGDTRNTRDTIVRYHYTKLGPYQISLQAVLPNGCDSIYSRAITLWQHTLLPREKLPVVRAAPDAEAQTLPVTKDVALALILLLFGLLWLTGEAIYYLWKRLLLFGDQASLKKRFTAGDYPPYRVPFPPQDQHVSPPGELYVVAERFRQRSVSDLKRINVKKSIYSSVRSGGHTRIVFNQISRPSEYLVLIDEQTANNQQARFFDYLISAIEREDVFLEKFYYRQDFRLCWNRKYADGLTPEQLFNKFPQHRLVLFTSGDVLTDPHTGNVREWVRDALKPWKDRVLLTPIPVEFWGLPEYMLNEIIPVLPASLEAQQLIVDTMTGVEPSLLSRTIERFRERHMPPAALDLSHPDHIRQFLGKPTFLWLCCLALYNKVQWEITLAIGRRLQEEYPPFKAKNIKLLRYENLARLTRIDCMRHGVLPPDLRGHLLQEIKNQPELEMVARSAILDLLEATPVEPNAFAYREHQIELAVQSTFLNKSKTEKRAVFFLWKKGMLDRLLREKFRPVFEYHWGKAALRGLAAAVLAGIFYFGTNKADTNHAVIRAARLDRAMEQWDMVDYIQADSAVLFHNTGVALVNMDSLQLGLPYLDMAIRYRQPKPYPLAERNRVIAEYGIAKETFDAGSDDPAEFLKLQSRLPEKDSLQAWLVNAIALCYYYQQDSAKMQSAKRRLESNFPWFMEKVHPNLMDVLNFSFEPEQTGVSIQDTMPVTNTGDPVGSGGTLVVSDTITTGSNDGTTAGGVLDLPAFPNVQMLDLYPKFAHITKLDTLVLQYPNLIFLNAQRLENLTDISPLARLQSLVSLNLSYTNVQSIASLRNLRQLDWLILKATKITDLKPLRGLSNLKRLDISRNPQLKSLDGLEGLNLEVLDARNTGIPEEELDVWYQMHPNCKRAFDQ